MKLSELKQELAKQPTAHVRFQLPSGEFTPDHVHVTEVARIDKRFIDCGGTLRSDALCRLQTWFADDVEHRLTADKLLKIFAKAETVLLSEDLDVDVEHEVGVITQFPLDSATVNDGQIILHLAERHTACLALDKCQTPEPPKSDLNPLKFDFREKSAAGKCCS